MSYTELLTKAIEFEKAGRYRECLKLYTNGIAELMQAIRTEEDAVRKRHFEVNIGKYMARAEQIKMRIPAIVGAVIDKVHIMDGDTGYDYERVLGRYLTHQVTEVQLEETYLREHHQLNNLWRFCELAVLKCSNLKRIEVTTTRDGRPGAEQERAFEAMAKSLLEAKKVQLQVLYSEKMHDRQIILNNGYVIKIGRGLDYFKPASKYTLGYTEYKLRECRQCNVDILFCEENKTTNVIARNNKDNKNTG